MAEPFLIKVHMVIRLLHKCLVTGEEMSFLKKLLNSKIQKEQQTKTITRIKGKANHDATNRKNNQIISKTRTPRVRTST